MSWRDAFSAKDGVTIALSAAALLLSITTWRASVASGRRVGVTSQMQLYLGQYIALREASAREFEPCWYANEPDGRRERARIVTGLLIELIEAMDAARDRRAAAWRGRLTELKGPLYDPDWDPAIYASTAEMARYIAGLRRGHLGPVACTTGY